VDIKPFIDAGRLLVHSSRPSLQGLEMHLLVLNKLLKEFKPKTVIIDPISSLVTVGSVTEVRAMLIRLMDILKTNQINAFFTSLKHQGRGEQDDPTIDAVSSLADNWLNLENGHSNGKRSRRLLIVKSRGMSHYNDFSEFNITDKGVVIMPSKN